MTNVRSSLTYQILIHCNKPYSIFLFIALLALNLYKVNVLPYQQHVRIMELLIILAFGPIEAVRLAWAARGNLTETPAFVGFSLFLSAASGAICVYLAVFQNYVLLIEAIIIYVEAGFLILESIIGLTLVATLKGSN